MAASDTLADFTREPALIGSPTGTMVFAMRCGGALKAVKREEAQIRPPLVGQIDMTGVRDGLAEYRRAAIRRFGTETGLDLDGLTVEALHVVINGVESMMNNYATAYRLILITDFKGKPDRGRSLRAEAGRDIAHCLDIFGEAE